MSDDALLEFPCEFPVKIFGRDSTEFRSVVRDILERHAAPFDESRLRERPSGKGSYIAFTYTLHVESRDKLDALYRELTGHELVLFVL